MKRIAVACMLLLAAACGTKEPASPLDVLPEGGLVLMAVSDPAAIVGAIDGYIESGVPVAGPGLLTNLMLNELECTSMDSLSAMTGMDVHGTLTFYAAGMNPQTIGGAVSAPDADAFWARTTELGAAWVDAEPIGDAVVKTIALGDMTLNVATYRGLALFAGSRTEISAIIDRIEGNMPSIEITLEPSSMWMRMDVSMIGPMVSSQLSMYRPQIMSEVAADMTGPGGEMVSSLIGVYFDAFDLLLRETRTVEAGITFGPEMVDSWSRTAFVEGSSLAAAMVPVESQDLVSTLPGGGVIAARMALPAELTVPAMSAMIEAMGAPVDQSFIDATAAMSAGTAFVMYDDMPLHFLAVYTMPDGQGMAEVRTWLEQSIALAATMTQGLPGMTFGAPRDTTLAGVNYLMYEMVMDPAAMEAAGAQVQVGAPGIQASPESSMPAMNFTAWMTMVDGMLYLEMAPQPALLPAIAAGAVPAETMGADPFFSSAGTDKEMLFAVDMPGYMALIMSWAGEGGQIAAMFEGEAWIHSSVDITEGGLSCSSSFNGSDIARMIGSIATNAAALGGIQ